MRAKLAASALGAALLALGPALAEAAQTGPWRGPGEAPALYWAVVGIVVAGLLAFTARTLYGRRRAAAEKRPSTGRYHALGALVLVMTVFTLVLYLQVATRMTKEPATERAWNWAPGEVLDDPAGSALSGEPYRGYQIYLAQGCSYCHTQYIRPQDIETGWAVGATEADVTRVGDLAHYPFTLLGTQRNGPDLTIAGKRVPDMRYQIEHLKAPRRFRPDSIMPSYAYLSERDIRDLAGYLVSLGNPPEKLRRGEIGPVAALEAPAVARGEELYRSQGCIACHSTDGSVNVGPSFQGLYGREESLSDGSTVVADADYLKRSILAPNAELVEGFAPLMPSFEALTEEELDALVAFIKSLEGEEG